MKPDRERIASALEVTHGNVTRAALALSVSAGWLHARLHEYQLHERAKELRVTHAGRSMGKPRATPGPSDDVIRAAWTAHGCVRAVARALVMPRSTVRYAVKRLHLVTVSDSIGSLPTGRIVSDKVGKVGKVAPILRPDSRGKYAGRPIKTPTLPPGRSGAPSG